MTLLLGSMEHPWHHRERAVSHHTAQHSQPRGMLPHRAVLERQVHPFHVVIGGYKTFSCVVMKDFLAGLAKRVKANSNAWDQYERMFTPQAEVPPSPAGSPLRTKSLFKHVQVRLAGSQHYLGMEKESLQGPGVRHDGVGESQLLCIH